MGNEAEAPAPSLPRIGEQIAGKYRIDRILATGGMGVVVSAKHIELSQRVAIKFLLPEMLDREELVARFLREAKAMVGLQGEHAVKVYDVGTLDTGSPYMVMELLRGNDLDEELEVHGPLDTEEAVHFFLQACEAIAEAHRIGIVHRDIKPSNLFLARRPDGSRSVKVLDFGISKLLADEAQRGHDNKLTTTAAMLGSPQYMSPEQVRSAKDVDGRTDIWSLGCVLYEMLANVPPFAAQSVSAVSAMIVTDEPPALDLLRPDAPPGLNDIVMRCLAKNREERYRTISELAQALAPFATPVSRNAIERVVRISQAPRYESSFPPAMGRQEDAIATVTEPQIIDEDSPTVSEVGLRHGAPTFPESEATLSATSTASRSGERAQHKRNGLLVGAAALLGAASVWALVGSTPEPASPASTVPPAEEEEEAKKAEAKAAREAEAEEKAQAEAEEEEEKAEAEAEPEGEEKAEAEPEGQEKAEAEAEGEEKAEAAKGKAAKQQRSGNQAAKSSHPARPTKPKPQKPAVEKASKGSASAPAAAPASKTLLPENDPLGSRK